MPVFSGVPVAISRMLGQVDQDDPTNLPAGCAAVCRNTDFTRDSTGGALSAATRAGNCLIMQGAAAPGTGFWDFQYQSLSATDPFFQQMLRFTSSGILERESPIGSGRLIPVPAGVFELPTASHKIDTQAGNRVWSAYSDLKTPTAGLSCYNPKTLTLDPLGMKPYGWQWLPITPAIYKGEVACPSNSNSGRQGNGHTYQAQNNGATGPLEPVWPTGPASEGAEVIEVLSPAQVAAGLVPVTWKELTMVIANRLPEPPAPVLALINAGGTFAANRTVYIFLTFTNGMGETVAGAVASITTTAINQGVQVTIPALADLPGFWQGTGFSLIARPNFANGNTIFLELNILRETIEFTTIGSPVFNRGSVQGDIAIFGLTYLHRVVDAKTGGALHIEPGLWLNIPATTDPASDVSIARLATIPHGNAVATVGFSQDVVFQGQPTIPPANTVPFPIGGTEPAPGTPNPHPEYNLSVPNAFRSNPLAPEITQAIIDDPNTLVRSALQGQTITKITRLITSTSPTVGIGNIPFISTNANTLSFESVFAIETIQDPTGTEFLQLQYSQTALLNFAGQSWPHVTVGTLIKAF